MSEPLRAYHLGLIGYPLGHSFSPRLHHTALKALGLRGEYRLFPIPLTGEGHQQIADLLAQVRTGVLDGLNITIPHKQTAIPMVDALTNVAHAVGAVNTLYVRDGKLIGDNTDVPGFLHDLGRLTGMPRGSAVVLGAGGSARAVAYALASSGWQVRVLARRVEQAAALVGEIASTTELAVNLEHGLLTNNMLAELAGSLDLIINTTPLGMHPKNDGCPWPEDLPLPAHAAVYDLVYNPLETILVHRARAAGLRAMNGAGMLVAQAALAFHKWTGLPAPFEIMERAFFEPLEAEQQ